MPVFLRPVSALRVQPGGEVLVDLRAVTSILVFGTLMQRAYPEFVQRVMDLATAFHAKIAVVAMVLAAGTAMSSPPDR